MKNKLQTLGSFLKRTDLKKNELMKINGGISGETCCAFVGFALIACCVAFKDFKCC